MALCGITYRCGHTDTVQIEDTNLFGKRKKKIAWYRTIDCPACRTAKVRRKLDFLPVLEGSDEQVARAADIREKLMELMELMDETQEDHDGRAEHGATEEGTELGDRTSAWLRAQASASWWVDHQDPVHAILDAQEALRGQGD